MLATQRMSSHGGQLPFGYNPTAIQSIGLPEFLSPGEPLGQSILNDEESSTLNHFFSDFESNQPPQAIPLQFAPPQSSQQPLFAMPPLYFGSETSDGTGPGIDPHTLQLDGQPHAYPNQPTHTSNPSGHFDPPLLDQLHGTAAGVEHPQPGFTPNWNQQPYQPQGMPLQTPGRGPMMRFGSDSHFTQSGFQLPNASAVVDSEDATLSHWLPSAPNSRPPTQPSSPNCQVKYEPHAGSQPLGRVPPRGVASANPAHSPSVPALWPNSKARPSQANRPPSIGKPPRKRKKSTASTTPTVTNAPFPPYSASNGLASNRPKSSPSKPARAPSTRVPLTTEQKKANHTNSEQRRRDATARAYAELYDLVPEVSEMGKQSTMKKLELVVDKVSWTISAVESLRAKLGMKKGSSVGLIKGGHGPSYPGHAEADDSFINHAAHASIDGVAENASIDGDACYPGLD
ncbi:hypothetical protein DV737_g3803, partial [Chaetothyriales sp. CBS 132003]